MCDAHRFWSKCINAHLGVGFYAFLATLNSKPALFVATKRDRRAQHEPAAVDPDCADLEGAWHIIGSVQIIGENTSCQAVHTVVGALYYLLNDNISLCCWAFIRMQRKAWFCWQRGKRRAQTFGWHMAAQLTLVMSADVCHSCSGRWMPSHATQSICACVG